MKKSTLVLCFLVTSAFLLCALPTLYADDAQDVETLRRVRTAQLNDPWRPLWHFVAPEGVCDPFDPNGAICKDGVYHLWYLFQSADAPCNRWAHISSKDLLHWRFHSFVLEPNETTVEKGINSGGACMAPDGTVILSYQGVQAGADGNSANCIAYSTDPDLDVWTRAENNPTAAPCSDVCIWYENDRYYVLSGWTNPTLFSGASCLEPLELVGNFMKRDMPDVESYEDLSCPDFFQLGDKRVLMGISHQKGGRYYIGTWDGKQFTPEAHERTNRPGGNNFAGESLLDDSGRRIFWSWLRSYDSANSCGILSLPCVLTLNEDETRLNFEPAKELENLRFRPKSMEAVEIEAGQTLDLAPIQGKSLELDVRIDPKEAKRFGIKVFCSQDGQEETPIVVDLERQTLTVKLDKSSLTPYEYREFFLYRDPNPEVKEQVVPIDARPNEKIRLRVFLDKSTLEIFVGGRLISQLVRPTLPDAQGVRAFADDAPIQLDSVYAWELFPTNQQ